MLTWNGNQASIRIKHQGFALLLTLIVVLILSTLVIDLSYTSRVSATIAGNQRDQTNGIFLAKSGIRFSLLRLEIDKMVDKAFGAKDDLNEAHWTIPFAYPTGLAMLGSQLEESGISKEMAENFSKQYDVGGAFVATITDESSRLNLNAVKVNGNNPNGSYLLLQNLLSSKKFKSFFRDRTPTEVINNLVDWLDDDNISRDLSGGMENDFYQLSKPAYHSKNGPLFSINELALIKKITPELLDALKPFVTVYPYSTTKFLGPDYGHININTIPAELIGALFDTNQVSGADELTKKIVESRDKTSFKNKNEFLAFLDNSFGIPKTALYNDVINNMDVRSDIFRINSVATVNDTEVEIETLVDRSTDKTQYYYWQVN
jgi:general secretion pathway protein K